VQSFTSSVIGQSVTYSATFCSLSTDETQVVARLWTNRSSQPFCNAPGYSYNLVIPSLDAHTCQTYSGTMPGFNPGSYSSWVFLDATCAVTELNESDNAFATGFTVSP
jgi:hypothetical protein